MTSPRITALSYSGSWLIALWALTAGAAQGDELYPCEIERIIDADSIVVGTLRGNWGFALVDRTFRLTGFDAHESRRGRSSVGEITDHELVLGKHATDALKDLVGKSKKAYLAPPELPRPQQDPYGRLLGRLYLRMESGELIDVSAYMVSHDHDRDVFPSGERRPK